MIGRKGQTILCVHHRDGTALALNELVGMRMELREQNTALDNTECLFDSV